MDNNLKYIINEIESLTPDDNISVKVSWTMGNEYHGVTEVSKLFNNIAEMEDAGIYSSNREVTAFSEKGLSKLIGMGFSESEIIKKY